MQRTIDSKPVYNYDIEQCNRLFKKGIVPIGVGTNNNSGSVFVVFRANRKYFDTIKLLEYEDTQSVEKTVSENTTFWWHLHYSATLKIRHKNVVT